MAIPVHQVAVCLPSMHHSSDSMISSQTVSTVTPLISNLATVHKVQTAREGSATETKPPAPVPTTMKLATPKHVPGVAPKFGPAAVAWPIVWSSILPIVTTQVIWEC